MGAFAPASGFVATPGGPDAIASTWQPGIGFFDLVFVTPVVITMAYWIVIRRMIRNLPNQPTSGQRLSALTSSLNAVSRSMGGAGLRESGLRTAATLTPGTRVVIYHDVAEPDQLLVAWEERAEPPRTDPRGAGA